MKQLSALDALFLYLETPATPMHVGALHLFELPAGLTAAQWTRQIRAHLAARLHLAPALSRRLRKLPLNVANPTWERCEPGLDWHIQTLKLPPARSEGDALNALVADLHAQTMDRERPLWQFFVIGGLPRRMGARTVALYTKVHHAAVDGKAGVALAQVLLDITPVPRDVGAPPEHRQPVQFGTTALIKGALANQMDQASNLVRQLPGTLTQLTMSAGKLAWQTALTQIGTRLGLKPATRTGKPAEQGNWSFGPRLPFNRSVSNTRSFATARLPLGELKGLAHAHGATLNDAVLFLVGGALRHYLKQKRLPLPRKSVIAAMPISLRAEGDTRANTQATMTAVSLATHLSKPADRLAAIMRTTGSLKGSLSGVKHLIPTDLPSIGLPWLITAGTQAYGASGLADRIAPLANLVISNVPGPQLPLYLAGAKMLTYTPVSIIIHGVGLNITVQSYNGQLDIGLIADGKTVPDLQRIADGMQVAFEELASLSPPAQP
ncbi:MAG TPA: wax ester/triacylglycerol synthase family O-acyltransferase [Burkholderiaceae bacterium]|nr:wax ester/triacylglycerol synthase family O-acyltransferase [Burkholderiaceae bacterium]